MPEKGDKVWYYPQYPIETESGVTDRKKMLVLNVRESGTLDLAENAEGTLNLKCDIPLRSETRFLRAWAPIEEE